jgi:hypothetical protein
MIGQQITKRNVWLEFPPPHQLPASLFFLLLSHNSIFAPPPTTLLVFVASVIRCICFLIFSYFLLVLNVVNSPHFVCYFILFWFCVKHYLFLVISFLYFGFDFAGGDKENGGRARKCHESPECSHAAGRGV